MFHLLFLFLQQRCHSLNDFPPVYIFFVLFSWFLSCHASSSPPPSPSLPLTSLPPSQPPLRIALFPQLVLFLRAEN